MLTPNRLGSAAFKEAYGLDYAYVTGAMVKGIASPALVTRIGQMGGLAFLGTGGLGSEEIEQHIRSIESQLGPGRAFGVNFLFHPGGEAEELRRIDDLLRLRVSNIEASAYMQVTPALVKFRLRGLREDGSGGVRGRHRIMAKVSRPEIARLFLSPPPEELITSLLATAQINADEARLGRKVSLATDITVEADSGGHTDMGDMPVLLPTLFRLRDRLQAEWKLAEPVRIGVAGGIGTPESVAMAYLMGADYVVTGSMNQCTVEAQTSDLVKDMLQGLDVQDTAYAPAGDMFELGAKIQVLKKGVFFPMRATKLFDLWRTHSSLESLPAGVRAEIEGKYLSRSFEDVWRETEAHYRKVAPAEIERAERDPRARMALVFKWYFVHSMRLALSGHASQRTNFQVHTGPVMGAVNQWLAGSAMEDWRNRHVDELGLRLLEECAKFMDGRMKAVFQS